MVFEQGLALLIGVGRYAYLPKANIPISVNDARQMGDVLASERLCGYKPENITFLHDQKASRDGILKALKTLAQKSTSKDTVLIYYSGHGKVGSDGLFYMTTHDTQLAGDKIAQGTGIDEKELLAALRDIPAGKLIFFFNACYSGEISSHFGLDDEPDSFGSENLPNTTADAILASGSGRMIITACREQQKSWIGRGEISIFAQALVDGLKGRARYNAGYIGAFGLYEYLYEAVKEAAGLLGHEQEPELTVRKGLGPFPVALYHGMETQSFDLNENLPKGIPVRRISRQASIREFQRIINIVVNTGGGDFASRDLNKVTAAGDINAPVTVGDNNVSQQNGVFFNGSIGQLNVGESIVGGNQVRVIEPHFDFTGRARIPGQVKNRQEFLVQLRELRAALNEMVERGEIDPEIATQAAAHVDAGIRNLQRPQADPAKITQRLTRAREMVEQEARGTGTAVDLLAAFATAIENVRLIPFGS